MYVKCLVLTFLFLSRTDTALRETEAIHLEGAVADITKRAPPEVATEAAQEATEARVTTTDPEDAVEEEGGQGEEEREEEATEKGAFLLRPLPLRTGHLAGDHCLARAVRSPPGTTRTTPGFQITWWSKKRGESLSRCIKERGDKDKVFLLPHYLDHPHPLRPDLPLLGQSRHFLPDIWIRACRSRRLLVPSCHRQCQAPWRKTGIGAVTARRGASGEGLRAKTRPGRGQQRRPLRREESLRIFAGGRCPHISMRITAEVQGTGKMKDESVTAGARTQEGGTTGRGKTTATAERRKGIKAIAADSTTTTTTAATRESTTEAPVTPREEGAGAGEEAGGRGGAEVGTSTIATTTGRTGVEPPPPRTTRTTTRTEETSTRTDAARVRLTVWDQS